MAGLKQDQIDRFWEDGCITVPDAATPDELAALRAEFAGWVEESRAHATPWGEMMDGRPRFDIDAAHSPAAPLLRRVSSPTEISDAFLRLMHQSRLADLAASLLGPAIRFHHSKINSKLPGSPTIVDWHQDFAFTPHSNDDQVTVLLFLDEVTDENGPLRVARGSHKGPIHSHWRDGRFLGAVAPEVAEAAERDVVYSKGPAGSACIMHSRALHASTANRSDAARTLFICDLAAADALALTPNPVPSAHQGMILRGEDPKRVRATAYEMELPEVPKSASFFNQQAGVDA